LHADFSTKLKEDKHKAQRSYMEIIFSFLKFSFEACKVIIRKREKQRPFLGILMSSFGKTEVSP